MNYVALLRQAVDKLQGIADNTATDPPAATPTPTVEDTFIGLLKLIVAALQNIAANTAGG
jgi:hypothetical protein